MKQLKYKMYYPNEIIPVMFPYDRIYYCFYYAEAFCVYLLPHYMYSSIFMYPALIVMKAHGNNISVTILFYVIYNKLTLRGWTPNGKSSVLYALSQLSLNNSRYYYDLHFTEEETET
jgi:hypothetical protein